MECAEILSAELFGGKQDPAFHSVSIDSRNIKVGELFVAIKGENFDGHQFVQEAAKKGAVAAVVELRL